MLMVLTRRDLMSAHIVVLPTPTSLQAVFTEYLPGFWIFANFQQDIVARLAHGVARGPVGSCQNLFGHVLQAASCLLALSDIAHHTVLDLL